MSGTNQSNTNGSSNQGATQPNQNTTVPDQETSASESLALSRGYLLYQMGRAHRRGRMRDPRDIAQYAALQNRVFTDYTLDEEQVPVVIPRGPQDAISHDRFPHVARQGLTREEARAEQRRRVGTDRIVDRRQPRDILLLNRRARLGSQDALDAEWRRFRLGYDGELADRGYGQPEEDDDEISREIEAEIRGDGGDGDSDQDSFLVGIDSDQDSVMGDPYQDADTDTSADSTGPGVSSGKQGSNTSRGR